MFKKLTLIMMMLLCSVVPIHGQKSYLTLGLQAQPLAMTKVKITGKIVKKNIKKASYYRLEKAKGKASYRLLAKLKKPSYIDCQVTKNTRYRYRLTAYYKGKKLSSADATAYTGVGKATFFEYQRSDTKFTPTSIELKGTVENGLTPQGYYVYRKKGKKYALLAHIKAASKAFRYVDKKVKGGQGYSYQFAGYRKEGKKTYIGPKSSAITMYACHAIGTFTSHVTMQKGAYVLTLTSDAFNGPLTLTKQGLRLTCEQISDLYLDRWSLDGRNYTTDQKITLMPGKSLYLLVKSQSHQVITEDKLEVDLEEDASSCRYASCPAHFKTPYDATGYAQLNFEYIH